MKEKDIRKIKGVVYFVKVGDMTYQFETGSAAINFADIARKTCTAATWCDEWMRVTIELFPILDDDGYVEDDLEKLEEECEA